MTYQEAQDKLLVVKWKTVDCGDIKCWCRMILPEDPIIYDEIEEIYVCGAGAVNKKLAEHIVNNHNKSLK